MKTVIGMDLGDKQNYVVVMNESGEETVKKRIANTSAQVERFFAQYPGAVVVIEAGTHSPWVSRLLERNGHEVHIGDPRKLKAIWGSNDKSDERDARILALMYRLEPRLLHTIHHRSERAQADLALVKARQQLVGCRSKLINHIRGTVKVMGSRIRSGGADTFHRRARTDMPACLKKGLMPLLDTIEDLTIKIHRMDLAIHKMCDTTYSETEHLRQIHGVGPVTALAYVLTLEEPKRFAKSRAVGAFVGLTPRRDQSGATDKQLRITKAGNTYLRQLLVSCAHYILGPFGADCDLRRYGLRIAARGGKNAKKRAVVAVARKLAVLLHRLWTDRSVYMPLKKGDHAAA